MADIADLAGEQIEVVNAALLSVRKPAGPKAVGHCLYCKNGLPHGLRWCDSDCQKDWEAEQDAMLRNGG